MNLPTGRRWWLRSRQILLPFLEGRLRRERRFKLAIVAATGLTIAAMATAHPEILMPSAAIDAWAARTFGESLRVFRTRDEIDESWRRIRQAGIANTRIRTERIFARSEPALQALMRYAGMDPEHALFGWGNYDWTLLLSSKVFEPDQSRSYRLRPGVASIWLRDIKEFGIGAFFLVPDGPGLADACRGTGATLVAGSRQTTNSWGLRGPEPNIDAPLRVLVLGDSYMQGMFIGDDETPPECLHRYLDRALGLRTSVLNGGLMGYSTDQYYDTLMAYADRFRPHIVVVSVFANDCGNALDAITRGGGDWNEGRYWLDGIARDCRGHGRLYLVVPAPFEPSLIGKRRPGNFPGRLADILPVEGPAYLDPMDDFLNAHLRARVEERRRGRVPKGCVLFNDAIDDRHFSAVGSEVWAESVGRRIVLMLEDAGMLDRHGTPGQGDPQPTRPGAGLAGVSQSSG